MIESTPIQNQIKSEVIVKENELTLKQIERIQLLLTNKEINMQSTVSLKSFISDEKDDNNDYESIDTNELLSDSESLASNKGLTLKTDALKQPSIYRTFKLSNGQDTFKLSSVQDTFKLSSAHDTFKLSSAQDTFKLSNAQDTFKLSSAQDTFKLSNAQDTFKLSSAQDTLKATETV